MFRGSILILQLLLAVNLIHCHETEKRSPEVSTQRRRLFGDYVFSPESPYEDFFGNDDQDDPGEPLFLTPLIEANETKVARNKSKVDLTQWGYTEESHSGYFTVNKKMNSNMFFWFFRAQNNSDTAPLVVWLQGGPGGSSLFGLFRENGPFSVTKTENNTFNLVERPTSWHLDHNLLYFDNPVGTGFSFTDEDGYCRDETCVGDGLYSALQQFLEVFDDLRAVPLYITGESYAGKYVPAFAYTIHKNNPVADKKINLKGVAIGNGLCDPINMVDYGGMLYGIGLIREYGKEQFESRQRHIVEMIEQEEWRKAFEGFDEILNGDLIKPEKTLFEKLTGLKNYFNYEFEKDKVLHGIYPEFVQTSSVRKALHVGNLTYNDGHLVEEHLVEDVMKSVRPWVQELLGSYEVVLYNGQADIIVAYYLTKNFVNALEWDGKEEFNVANRTIWKVDGAVAGYTKSASNLTEIVVRNAGHMVPTDQPARGLDLIRRVTGIIPGGFSDQE